MLKVKIWYYKTNPITPSQVCGYSMMSTYNGKFLLFDFLASPPNWGISQKIRKEKTCEHNKD